MGTAADDYDPWKAAAMLYRVADAAEQVARIRGAVAASLRGVSRRTYPDERADALERAAARARRYAHTLRERAWKLTGWQPWRGDPRR
jgi:hypothetical protein